MVRKLIVEVVAAKALMPKDGQGSTNAYCVVRHVTQAYATSVPSPREFLWVSVPRSFIHEWSLDLVVLGNLRFIKWKWRSVDRRILGKMTGRM